MLLRHKDERVVPATQLHIETIVASISAYNALNLQIDIILGGNGRTNVFFTLLYKELNKRPHIEYNDAICGET